MRNGLTFPTLPNARKGFNNSNFVSGKYCVIPHKIGGNDNDECWQAKGKIPTVKLLVTRVGEAEGSRSRQITRIDPPTVIRDRSVNDKDTHKDRDKRLSEIGDVIFYKCI